MDPFTSGTVFGLLELNICNSPPSNSSGYAHIEMPIVFISRSPVI
jgi:hypothetical protein